MCTYSRTTTTTTKVFALTFNAKERLSLSLSLFRSFSRVRCVLRVRLFPRINEEEYVLWGEKMTDAALYEGKK
jgi:hypothetical protein